MGKKTLIKNLPDLNKARVRNAGFNIEYDNIVPSSFLIEKLKGKNYFIRTYGCQANVRDEETMSGMLDLVGMNKVDDEKIADVIIINTCAVRENAEDKVFGEIGNLKALKQKAEELDLDIDFEVDGGIKQENVEEVVSCGANIVVVGTALLHAENPKEFVSNIKSL